MRTRKRAYHSEEKEEKISSKFHQKFQPGKRSKESWPVENSACSSNNPVPKRPKKRDMDYNRFVNLLEEVCNGHHDDKIDCFDVLSDLFWPQFAAIWISKVPITQNLDSKRCEAFLKALHTKMENGDIDPYSRGVVLKPKLDTIFKQHQASFVVWELEQVPDTPPEQIRKGTISAGVSVSIQKTSTTSSIDQESITAIEVAMQELVEKRFLNYVDLQEAEQYLYTSKLAANTFLKEHDLKKRCDVIKESNAAWRERSVEIEWMKNKRQCR